MGCHFLLQCIKVKSESEVAQSCPSLSDPMDCSLPGSSVHGIFQARVLSGVPLPSPLLCSAAKSLQSCPTLQPHRQQPTRLPRPCSSPGKNTGVSCHFLLQCIKVKSEREVALTSKRTNSGISKTLYLGTENAAGFFLSQAYSSFD